MKESKPQRTAVVLFNLGGPDCLEAVRPFLFNLFNDPAILRIPKPMRYVLARLISWRRNFEARKIYDALGGKSPILENTQAQAKALGLVLGEGFRVFVCMRYWSPMANEVVRQVQSYAPHRIVLMSLYPQYSTTTIESSLADWHKVSAGCFSEISTDRVGCYPSLEGMISTLAGRINEAVAVCEKRGESPRVLFSAHGLPQKIVDRGDPYQGQIEETVAAILNTVPKELDSQICYQSRVGPLKWLQPSTEHEIIRAGQEGKSVVIVPVSFVSEHSETLYELDIEYKVLAKESGVPHYLRVQTVGEAPDFIRSLAGLIVRRRGTEKEVEYA